MAQSFIFLDFNYCRYFRHFLLQCSIPVAVFALLIGKIKSEAEMSRRRFRKKGQKNKLNSSNSKVFLLFPCQVWPFLVILLSLGLRTSWTTVEKKPRSKHFDVTQEKIKEGSTS